MNLLEETLTVLTENLKTPNDVQWVGGITSWHHDKQESFKGSWGDFTTHANFDYDNSYGSAEITPTLVVVGIDWWIERCEYDGSEWWEFKTLPVPDKLATSLRADHLRNR